MGVYSTDTAAIQSFDDSPHSSSGTSSDSEDQGSRSNDISSSPANRERLTSAPIEVPPLPSSLNNAKVNSKQGLNEIKKSDVTSQNVDSILNTIDEITASIKRSTMTSQPTIPIQRNHQRFRTTDDQTSGSVVHPRAPFQVDRWAGLTSQDNRDMGLLSPRRSAGGPPSSSSLDDDNRYNGKSEQIGRRRSMLGLARVESNIQNESNDPFPSSSFQAMQAKRSKSFTRSSFSPRMSTRSLRRCSSGSSMMRLMQTSIPEGSEEDEEKSSVESVSSSASSSKNEKLRNSDRGNDDVSNNDDSIRFNSSGLIQGIRNEGALFDPNDSASMYSYYGASRSISLPSYSMDELPLEEE